MFICINNLVSIFTIEQHKNLIYNLEPVTPSFPILGIDYGLKHIGLAISDKRGKIATPLPTFHITKNRNKITFIENIREIIKAQAIKLILIGLPQDFTKEESISVKRIKNFIVLLKQKIDTPITTFDESFSTKNAQNMLLSIGKSQKRSRDNIDSYACTAFLQEYLDSLNEA